MTGLGTSRGCMHFPSTGTTVMGGATAHWRAKHARTTFFEHKKLGVASSLHPRLERNKRKERYCVECRAKVVGVGVAGVDYLAQVATFPDANQSLRTEHLLVQGGGNCANALTGAAKLGLKPVLLTKVGDDRMGEQAISELQNDGVDTSNVLIAEGSPTPFTYVIVDKKGGTRTCIHTPSEGVKPKEITEQLLDSLLAGVRLVYFDGRLTEAAAVVAKEAQQRGIQILVEGERLRPNLGNLLDFADYIVTSSHFPQDMTGEDFLGDALLGMLARFPRAQTITTTLGSKGSITVERIAEDDQGAEDTIILEDFLDTAFLQLDDKGTGNGAEQIPACTSKNGVKIRSGRMVESGVSVLRRKKAENEVETSLRAREIAVAVAAASAENDNGDQVNLHSTPQMPTLSALKARVWVSSAATIDPDAIVDTTGAGDAFIAAVLYSLAKGLSIKDMVNLATVSAACKCTAMGARFGQARVEDLRSDLLG